MVRQLFVNWKYLFSQMWRDFLRLCFLLYIAGVAVFLITSLRDRVLFYPVYLLICFCVSYVLCFRRKDKPSDLVEGDK